MDTVTINRENVIFDANFVSFDEMHGITLCCVVLNQEKLLPKFLEWHKPFVDEIVIIDGGSTDKTVYIAESYGAKVIINNFNGNYSDQANLAFSVASKDWILLMDPDEKMDFEILDKMKDLINQENYDCYSFPRKNYIDGIYDVTSYPDYQDRLFRSYCRRIRPVHGEMVGFKRKCLMTQNDGNHIRHSKSSRTHSYRNEGYIIYEFIHKNEMGEPGCQTKENFIKKYPQCSTGDE